MMDYPPAQQQQHHYNGVGGVCGPYNNNNNNNDSSPSSSPYDHSYNGSVGYPRPISSRGGHHHHYREHKASHNYHPYARPAGTPAMPQGYSEHNCAPSPYGSGGGYHGDYYGATDGGCGNKPYIMPPPMTTQGYHHLQQQQQGGPHPIDMSPQEEDETVRRHQQQPTNNVLPGNKKQKQQQPATANKKKNDDIKKPPRPYTEYVSFYYFLHTPILLSHTSILCTIVGPHRFFCECTYHIEHILST